MGCSEVAMGRLVIAQASPKVNVCFSYKNAETCTGITFDELARITRAPRTPKGSPRTPHMPRGASKGRPIEARRTPRSTQGHPGGSLGCCKVPSGPLVIARDPASARTLSKDAHKDPPQHPEGPQNKPYV